MVIEFGDWQLRPVDSLNWQLWHRHAMTAGKDKGTVKFVACGKFYSYSTLDNALLYAADCDIKAMDGTVDFPEYVSLLRETLDGFEKSILRGLESSQSRAN